MKLLQYNEFNQSTIELNNSKYSEYLRSNIEREKKVAWIEKNSQYKNFKLISNYIKDGDSLLDFGCGLGDLLSHLKDEDIEIGDYLGVDINYEFISISKETYPDNKFELIRSVEQIEGNYDIVCAIGVFTWFITKDDFIETINGLYNICNKEVMITCLGWLEKDDIDWASNYRKYNIEIFKKLFPYFKIESEVSEDDSNTILIRIIKD